MLVLSTAPALAQQKGAQPDLAKAQSIAAPVCTACAGCHGPAGAGIPGQYPRLAGQYAEYVASQLKSFRDIARSNDQNGMMRGVAARMSEREIRAVAEYA